MIDTKALLVIDAERRITWIDIAQCHSSISYCAAATIASANPWWRNQVDRSIFIDPNSYVLCRRGVGGSALRGDTEREIVMATEPLTIHAIV